MIFDEWKPLGKLNIIRLNNKEYKYQIGKYKSNNIKTIRFNGIIPYSEYQLLKEKLSKKYKWYK